MRKRVFVAGVICALTAGAAIADSDCGVGRTAVSIDATVQIAQEIGGCSLLDRPLLVRRLFPTSEYLYNLGWDGKCFTGEINGTAWIGEAEVDIKGTSLSAQYAGNAFRVFDPDPEDGDPTPVVGDKNGVSWYAGEANTYIELTNAKDGTSLFNSAFDDTFFYTIEGADTEKFVAVSPGVSGVLVAEGAIFWPPGAPLNGWLCVANTLLR